MREEERERETELLEEGEERRPRTRLERTLSLPSSPLSLQNWHERKRREREGERRKRVQKVFERGEKEEG